MDNNTKLYPKSRILVVNAGGIDSNGGVGRMVSYYTREMANDSSCEIIRLDSYGKHGKLAMPFYFLRACIVLVYLCALNRVDLVHIHMAAHGSLLRKLSLLIIARTFSVPVLLHVHGGRFAVVYERLPGFLQALVRNCFHRATAIIALSESWRNFFIDSLSCNPEQVIALPNAVADPGMMPVRNADTWRKLLFLGSLTEHKGVSELLVALSNPRLNTLDWRIKIAGPGPLEHYRQMGANMGLQDRVQWLGLVSENQVQKLLFESEILVCPSRNEGMPMVILEAMSYGLAIVATPVGAIPEIVTNGWNGMLVPFGDSTALACAISEIIEDQSLRERMMMNSRRQFLDRFQIASYTAALLSIYARFSKRRSQ